MKWVSALSTRPSLEAAVDEVIAATQAALGATPHLGFVFISSTFASEYPRLLPLLNERLQLPALIGCGCGGVIGNQVMATGKEGREAQEQASDGGTTADRIADRTADRTADRVTDRVTDRFTDSESLVELEDEPALVLCLAHLPGATASAFWLDEEDLPDLDSPPSSWVDYVGVDPRIRPDFVLIADPFTSKISDLLQGMDFAYPGSVKVGGMASGGTTNRANGLFCNDQYYEDGTVGVALSGDVTIRSVVAQGCRPVGPIFRVVEGERNIILKIEAEELEQGKNKPPLEALQALLRQVTQEERALAQRSLCLGVAYSEFQAKLGQGNFLIRSLVGIDPRVGAIAIGEQVRPGQRIQFHLRDAAAASEDLAAMLERHLRSMEPTSLDKPFGALMFSCMGRGEELYDASNVDSQILQTYLAPLPVGGFFSDGEIGPIGAGTYLHRYTAVFALFYERHSKNKAKEP